MAEEVEEEEAAGVEVTPRPPHPSQNPRKKKPHLQLTCSVAVMVVEETIKAI